MAGTVEYTWQINFNDGRKPSFVVSLAPLKSDIKFAIGNYRDLNGSTHSDAFAFQGKTGAGTDAYDNVITLESGTTIEPLQTLVETDVVPATSGTFIFAAAPDKSISYPDDVSHTPHRIEYATFSCWVFTNAAGDVVDTVRCSDVLDYQPVVADVVANPVAVITPSDSTTFDPSTHLYAVGAGNIKVGYADGTTDIITVGANTVRPIAVVKVFLTGTTATGILIW